MPWRHGKGNLRWSLFQLLTIYWLQWKKDGNNRDRQWVLYIVLQLKQLMFSCLLYDLTNSFLFLVYFHFVKPDRDNLESTYALAYMYVELIVHMVPFLSFSFSWPSLILLPIQPSFISFVVQENCSIPSSKSHHEWIKGLCLLKVSKQNQPSNGISPTLQLTFFIHDQNLFYVLLLNLVGQLGEG